MDILCKLIVENDFVVIKQTKSPFAKCFRLKILFEKKTIIFNSKSKKIKNSNNHFFE